MKQVDLQNFIGIVNPVESVDNTDTYFKNNQDKRLILGQYFTKPKIVKRVLDLVFEHKDYPYYIKVLEPSSGTGNFINGLKERGFLNIEEYEIDKDLTSNPRDFFELPIENKYDLIIGNPPFTKYNLLESYYFPGRYKESSINPKEYLPTHILKKEKEKIENAFILKSLRHLADENSTIAFVLPVSFFIKKRNSEVKQEIRKKFSTLIIFQNKEIWFDYNIPCCFAIFTNVSKLKDKILLIMENSEYLTETLNISDINEELIPEVIFNKKILVNTNNCGTELSKYLSQHKMKYNKSFDKNNISGKNILENIKIPLNEDVGDYKLAVVRVGNTSVGKCGLINIKNDILNDMFFVLDFKEEYQTDKKIKEMVCSEINQNQQYFKDITCRVGSKSIKKGDILSFRISAKQNI